MKLLLIALFAISTTFAAEIKLRNYDLVGVNRTLSLYELGKGVDGLGGYIAGRIFVQGGKAEEETIIILKDINKKDINGRYKMYIGYKTEQYFNASGSIQNYRIKRAKVEEFYYSGTKRNLFKEIFDFIEENKNTITGEVRFIVKPYTSSIYNISGTVQYVLK